MSDLVLCTSTDSVATLTLNRPDRLNALNVDLIDAFLEVLERVADDDSVKVVVVTGSGRAFSAGGDLGDMAAGKQIDEAVSSRTRSLRNRERTTELLHGMPKPTIAMINGACAGAGLSWACATDLRYCAESAKFNTAFLTAGVSGDFGASWTLPRLVGPARARELFLLPDRFDGREAERIGLVTRCVPDAELAATVQGVAERLAGSAPLALRGLKANLNESGRLSLAEHLDRESERHMQCRVSADNEEAAKAYLEKRAPVFAGR